MGALEIFLIIFGIILIVVSFVFGEHLSAMDKTTEYDTNMTGVIKEIVNKEVEAEVATIIDDKIEQAEVRLDKLTNEKIMALGDYSEDVNTKITKNHDEVMFLYDMLSDKEKTVKNTVKDIEALKVSVKKMVDDNDLLEDTAEEDSGALKEKIEAVMESPAESVSDISNDDKKDESVLIKDNVYSVSDNLSSEEMKNSRDNKKINSNKEILELYKQGKSTMEIAKELNLGMGEVKLVIDLFKTRK
ncbi:MAG: hypothetical protein IIX45_02155 [Lachnospiraceae bacterium]|nr:hypothetical protein [Lachnospiraceae bacterium]